MGPPAATAESRAKPDKGTDYLGPFTTRSLGRQAESSRVTEPVHTFWGGMGEKKENADKHERERTLKVNPDQAAVPGPCTHDLTMQRGKIRVGKAALLSTDAVDRHPAQFSPIRPPEPRVVENRKHYPNGRHMHTVMPEKYQVLYPKQGNPLTTKGVRILGRVPKETQLVPGPGRYTWSERRIKSQSGQRRGATVAESTLGKSGVNSLAHSAPEFSFGGTPHRGKSRQGVLTVTKDEYRAHPDRLTRSVRTVKSAGGNTGLLHGCDMATKGKLKKSAVSHVKTSQAFSMRGPGHNRSKFADGPPPRINVGARVEW